MRINKVPEQVLYLGRWVDKEHFRAFVYNETGKKLADNYAEYSTLVESGLWYSQPDNVPHTQKVVDIKPKYKRGMGVSKNAFTVTNS